MKSIFASAFCKIACNLSNILFGYKIMAAIYRTPRGCAFLDSRGFLEVVISQHSMLSLDDLDKIAANLSKKGISEILVLITRVNQYGVSPDYNILDLHQIGNLSLKKIAYYAPSPRDQTFSHLMGHTALKNVTYEVFSERFLAIEWLLKAEQDAAANP